MLVDVIEDHDVERVVREGQILSTREPEVHALTEAFTRLGQTRLVDVDAERGGPGERQFVGDEAGRAPDIKRLQPLEIRHPEPVLEDSDELGRLLSALALVEHLPHELGIGELFLAPAALGTRWLRP